MILAAARRGRVSTARIKTLMPMRHALELRLGVQRLCARRVVARCRVRIAMILAAARRGRVSTARIKTLMPMRHALELRLRDAKCVVATLGALHSTSVMLMLTGRLSQNRFACNTVSLGVQGLHLHQRLRLGQ